MIFTHLTARGALAYSGRGLLAEAWTKKSKYSSNNVHKKSMGIDSTRSVNVL